MTKEEYTIISNAIEDLKQNLLNSIARLGDAVRMATDDDDENSQ